RAVRDARGAWPKGIAPGAGAGGAPNCGAAGIPGGAPIGCCGAGFGASRAQGERIGLSSTSADENALAAGIPPPAIGGGGYAPGATGDGGDIPPALIFGGGAG
ncbi:hypothetical protein QHF89_47085, partial [Polyangium sorediatum]|nr:hypothetical protein [Polyangium sorediatum]